jgi:alkylation response protein AidB-like acyl-CoA dehydrogenase
MDSPLAEEQKDYIRQIEEFAAARLNEDPAPREEVGGYPSALWEACAEIGLTGIHVPVEYGGRGADAVTCMAAMEALGYGCRDNGLIFSLNAHLWAGVTPVIRYGTPEQKERYLRRIADGSLTIAHAATEHQAGSDVFDMGTTAERTASGWRLNGAKAYITNAGVADAVLVFATMDRDAGFAGLCAFLVDAGTPGMTSGPAARTMGLRTASVGEVLFDDCFVPHDAVLGRPGAGMAVFNAAMRAERSFILASAVGTMRRMTERAVAYARQRRQFGQRIGQFQAVSHRLVEMRLRWETSRALMYRLGRLIDAGQPHELEIPLVKLHLSESFVASSMDALSVYGAAGYSAVNDVERELRDALGSRLYSGTSDMQRNIAARLMGL